MWREFFYSCGWGTPNHDKMARSALSTFARWQKSLTAAARAVGRAVRRGCMRSLF